jgi:hypothetical protein
VATRTFVEHWDGHAWQTEQRRTHTFVDKSQKVSEVAKKEDNGRCCPENQAVHRDYHIGRPQRLHTSKSPNMIHSSTERTLGFIDETKLGNNKTHCSSEKDLLTCSEECNYTKYGQLTGLLSHQHQPTIGLSNHPINSRCSKANIKPRENLSIGPQTAVPSGQLQSSIRDNENSRQKVQ